MSPCAHVLAAPQVSLLEKHVGHIVVKGVDHEPFDLTDVAVSGVDALAAAYGHLARGDSVVGDGLRDPVTMSCPSSMAASLGPLAVSGVTIERRGGRQYQLGRRRLDRPIPVLIRVAVITSTELPALDRSHPI